MVTMVISGWHHLECNFLLYIFQLLQLFAIIMTGNYTHTHHTHTHTHIPVYNGYLGLILMIHLLILC